MKDNRWKGLECMACNDDLAQSILSGWQEICRWRCSDMDGAAVKLLEIWQAIGAKLCIAEVLSTYLLIDIFA